MFEYIIEIMNFLYTISFVSKTSYTIDELFETSYSYRPNPFGR